MTGSIPPVPESWYPVIEENRKPFAPELFVPERVGEIARVFMLHPDVRRTLHPEASLCVFNKTSDPTWLDHGFDDRDLIHPLHKLQNEHGKILFMGTDFDTCTSIHLTEFMSEHATLDTYAYDINIDGVITTKNVVTKYFDDADTNFTAIKQRYLEQYHDSDFYRTAKVGNAVLTLIDAHALFDIAKNYHQTH